MIISCDCGCPEPRATSISCRANVQSLRSSMLAISRAKRTWLTRAAMVGYAWGMACVPACTTPDEAAPGSHSSAEASVDAPGDRPADAPVDASGPEGAVDADLPEVDEGGAGTPDDFDGDGVANAVDNCPDHANPCQEDLDGDRVGDACDASCDVGCVGSVCSEWGSSGVPCNCEPCPTDYEVSVRDYHQPIGNCEPKEYRCFCTNRCESIADCPPGLGCFDNGGTCLCGRVSLTMKPCGSDAGADADGPDGS